MIGKKTGGRKAGTPNKLTHEYRQSLALALQGEIEALPETLASIEPYQRVVIMAKLLAYIMPPVTAVSIDDIDKATLNPQSREKTLQDEIEKDAYFNM